MTSWATQIDSGDVAWLLIMTVLPMVFTTAGFALVLTSRFQGNGVDDIWGRLPVLVASLLIAWGLWIYSLAFGPSWGTVPKVDPYEIQPMLSLQEIMEIEDAKIDETDSFGRGGLIGGLDYVGMNKVFPVAKTNGPHFPSRRPNTHVPHVLECLFRWTGLLLAIVPLWIVWSQRFRGIWLGLIGVLWSSFVFAPIAHWVWGDGWLEKLGTIDFGGGLLVMAVAFSGLKWNLGVPDSIPCNFDLSARQGLGTMLLWLGASLFVSAQTFHADGRAALALLNVLIGTSAGILVWSVCNGFIWKVHGLHSIGVGVIVCVAGMASSAGVVLPQSAIVIGAFIGFLANVWFHLGLKSRDATRSLCFSTLGMAAAGGLLSAGVFATTSVAVRRWDGRPVIGLMEGEPLQLLHQAVGVCSVGAWVFVVSWLLYCVVERCQTLASGRASPPTR